MIAAAARIGSTDRGRGHQQRQGFQMVQQVESVLIVGAGSAGWLSALVLTTYCPWLEVRLVKPRSGKPVGVGESTQGDMLRTLRAAGIDVQAFYQACDATAKCGIYYRDWNTVGSDYWHPFTGLASTGIYTPAHHYQQMILRRPDRFRHASYYSAVHPSYDICVKNRQVAPEAAIALHLDAHKIGEVLERTLTRVEVLDADNVDIKVADGRISELVLDGRSVSADLYIDCTGFSRALFKRVATPEIFDYEANVNAAVAVQLPYADRPSELTPYTRAHAHEHGWTWTIPLQSRIGSGYVYHRDFCTADQAEKNFRAYWGEERMHDISVQHISFDIGSLRNPWVENVVTVGLSAGFVEPLEATGLTWTIMSAYVLCQTITPHYYDQDTSVRYNANMLGFIKDIVDFVDAHYKLSARRDSEFWRYQTSRSYSDRLDFRLDLYGREMPTAANRGRAFTLAFNEVSWLDILNGYEFKYREQGVHPSHLDWGKRALRAIAAQPRQGIAPLDFQPGREQAQAAQALSYR
jgi:tryptophan halogenase